MLARIAPVAVALLVFSTGNVSAQSVAPLAANQKAGGSDFEQRLTALEIALSTIVAERPALWRFEPLEAEAAALLSDAATESERAAVRNVADRITSFDTLAARYRQLAQATPSTATHTPAPFRLTKARSIAPAATVAGQEYDAQGVLRPVVSQRQDAPRFALVDEQGKVTTFVTPSVGVDLQPMLGKRIALHGTRGYIPEYKHDHLTATRVTPLETLRR